MKHLIVLLFSFWGGWVFAQNISLSEIPKLGKLPVNAIHRIFQDSEGYMWYGTVDGLCRDDGYQVQVFRSDINTPRLLDNNLVECIAEDQQQKIWFGTDKGAYVLDKKDYAVRALDSVRLKNKQIHRIDATSDGFMWISISGSLLKYRTDGRWVRTYPIKVGNHSFAVSGFCESRKAEVIITVNGDGVYHLDRSTDRFLPYPRRMKRNNPTTLIQDKDKDYFWLVAWGDGVVRFDPSASADSMYVYQPLPVNARGEENGVILYLMQDDKQGHLWGTSSHNLVAFSGTKEGCLKQVSLPDLLPASNRMLNDLIKDRWGDLWVSAFDQPSFIVHFTDDTPKNYSLPVLRDRVDCNPAIMSLVDSGDGVMWISQERTGVCLYDLQTNRVSCYSDFDQTRKLSLGVTKMLAPVRANRGVWVVPEGTALVYRLERDDMTMRLVDQLDLSRSFPSEIIRIVYEETHGNHLWIGTLKGLYRYDSKTKSVICIAPTMGFVTSMVEASDGQLWVCTNDKGLYKVSPEGKVSAYPIKHGFSSIAISLEGHLWLGCEEGGIYSYNPHTNELKDYSDICRMNGDQVNQVLVDVFNHVWIDTNQKIIELNPRNGSFRTYLTTDKTMLLWRLIPTSICQGKDGNIYFGGIPGICSLTPSNRLEREAASVKTLITNVEVMGQSLIFGKRRVENSSASILLYSEDHNLEIYFSSLHHRFAHKIRYAYRLKGIDTDWIYTSGGKNSAFYNSLPKGNYIFQVKATDENGLWSNEVSELVIRRLPAFYETWWAYFLYVTLFSAFLVGSIYKYKKRMERKNNELWSDSQELMKMRHYLDSEVNSSEWEYEQLDKLLLEKAVKTVEDHLTEPDFGVTALAEAMSMSRSTLTRKLKAITGRTPLDFIRNIKMKHARRMLEDKNRNVSEIASHLGYFNRKYFASCFKEEFGMTPSEYQKSL